MRRPRRGAQRRAGWVWRALGWGVAGVLVVLLVITGGGFLVLRTSLPATAGRITVAGLHGEVTIARDADGIPTITAQNDDDVSFGLGYAHAQDRLFQMELQRRYGAGRLAELFGAAAVPVDTQMRVLGLYRAAEAAFPKLSPAVRSGIEAYGAGVNAYIATRGLALPPEFLMLRFSPEPWKPADTLIWGKLMDFQLGGNYRGELLRARLAQTVSAEDMAFLYPDYPKDAPRTLAELLPLYRQLPLGPLHAALPEAMGPHYASNNWVVEGAHTASGKPLLANDPHLGFATPGFWYLARLITPQHDIEGATAAGVPVVIIGHNEKIAWGFTTTTADIEDLFIEKLDAKDPGRYMVGDASEPFRVREETITVRDGAPKTLTVRSTRHGPVVDDALTAGTNAPGYVTALQTTFLDDDDASAEALWDIDRAGDWTSFRDGLKHVAGPPQNVVYADAAGTIGFIAAGRIPIRKKGDGWLPAPGWSGDYDWEGYIPFDQLPQGTNPASGHFVSANNKIVPDSYPYFISRDWDLADRAQRIEDLLAATPRQSPEASAAIQADTLSLEAARLVPLMTQIVPSSDQAREAIDRLKGWDFHMDADKVEPLLFTAWLRAFAHSVLFARLGAAAADYWDLKPQVMFAVLTQRPDWCADPQRSERETCETRLAASLDAALDELRRGYGNEMSHWQWGRAHIAEFPHPVFERIPWLRDWLRVAIPTPGGYDTVNRGPSLIRDEAHPYRQRFGAGLRIVTDLAAPEQSRMMIAPGQSGNPLSPHYVDLLSRWRAFGWLVPGSAATTETLTLAPAP
ncbi:MAG TPA: penicillin acylase family protein [Stellaceae bacterium]|nr:penicillin acylase family protein [Stellaceae bacterium]